jgi:hypothetical protein
MGGRPGHGVRNPIHPARDGGLERGRETLVRLKDDSMDLLIIDEPPPASPAAEKAFREWLLWLTGRLFGPPRFVESFETRA